VLTAGSIAADSIGAVASVETVWAWGDLMNGLQVFPNLVGLVA